jgi:hypothetical protein
MGLKMALRGELVKLIKLVKLALRTGGPSLQSWVKLAAMWSITSEAGCLGEFQATRVARRSLVVCSPSG